MSARAMWKGVIRFAGFALPVKLYSAVEDRTVHFHLLHDEDRVRVRQRMVHPRTDETVPPDRVRKGIALGPDTFVVLTDEELEGLRPEPSRDIVVTGFVDPGEIDHPWYVRPYWLGPDGDENGYFALADALGREGKEGVARWVMRNKRYAGALRVEGEHLLLVTLRHVEEVVGRDQVEAPGGRSATAQERELAERLVAALAGPFEPEAYRDEYRERVLALIEAKRRGETVEVIELPERASAASLRDALEASLAEAG